jgi:hypothetical protein
VKLQSDVPPTSLAKGLLQPRTPVIGIRVFWCTQLATRKWSSVALDVLWRVADRPERLFEGAESVSGSKSISLKVLWTSCSKKTEIDPVKMIRTGVTSPSDLRLIGNSFATCWRKGSRLVGVDSFSVSPSAFVLVTV